MNPFVVLLLFVVKTISCFNYDIIKEYNETSDKEIPETGRELAFAIILLIKHVSGPGGWEECSSTLVSPSSVITSAHCIHLKQLDPKNVFMVGGKNDLNKYVNVRMSMKPEEHINEDRFEVQERVARRIYEHPWYDPITKFGDIAVVEAHKPFKLGLDIRPIPLKRKRAITHSLCKMSGWQTYIDYKLRVVANVTVESYCATLISWLVLRCDLIVTYQYVAEKTGGPLVCDNSLAGIVTYTTEGVKIKGNNVWVEDKKTVFTELYHDEYWIESVTAGGHVSGLSFLRALFLQLPFSLAPLVFPWFAL